MLTNKTLGRIFINLFVIPLALQASEPESADHGYGSNDEAGAYAQVNGMRMYYETYGEGEPLILIHGNGQNIAGLHYQIAHFAKTYRVVVADSRGHGKSDLNTGHLTYVQMSEDWNALMEHLRITEAHVFGWSDGGILGLMLAINHPDKVGKLAVMGANLRPDPTAIYDWTAPIMEEMSQAVDSMIAAGDESDNWPLLRQHLDLLMTQPDIPVEDLHRIKAPVLLINGDKDIIRNDHQLEMFDNIPNAHLAILPGQTHWAPVSDPDGFNALVEKFFAEPFLRPQSRVILNQSVSGG